MKKIAYLKWMLENLPESDITLEQGKRDRWIGFIQGALWVMGIKTIKELREETRNNKHIEGIKKVLNT